MLLVTFSHRSLFVFTKDDHSSLSTPAGGNAKAAQLSGIRLAADAAGLRQHGRALGTGGSITAARWLLFAAGSESST